MALRSSAAQVEALTTGVHPPLAAIGRQHIDVILEVLHAAFDDLAINYGCILRCGIEAEINALMAARLSALLEEPEPGDSDYGSALGLLWRQLAKAVARGHETVSYNGEHLEKRPDLNIFLTFGHPSFPFIIECKIIDHPNGRSARLYCESGVTRFLRGEYGWVAQEVMMLGYVRDGSCLVSSLAPLLAVGRRPDRYAVLQAPLAPNPPPPDIAHSAHERTFRYVGRLSPHNDPGSLSIWHLWLPVPQPEAT
jgi:hypothetical protein